MPQQPEGTADGRAKSKAQDFATNRPKTRSCVAISYGYERIVIMRMEIRIGMELVRIVISKTISLYHVMWVMWVMRVMWATQCYAYLPGDGYPGRGRFFQDGALPCCAMLETSNIEVARWSVKGPTI